MISIALPGLAQVIHAVMLKYLYFDILYPELWMDKFLNTIGLDIDGVKNDAALTIEFENNGFQSKQFIKNAGSSLIYILIYLLGWLTLLIFTIVSKYSTKIWQGYQKKLKSFFMWN
jgi:hypothetical protein